LRFRPVEADVLPVEHAAEPPGDEKAARLGRRRGLGRRIAIQLGAVLTTIALWAAVSFAFVFVSFATSVCGTATANEVRGYRSAVLGYGLLMSLVPLGIGSLVRHVKEHAWPWFALAAVAAIVAVIAGLSAQPTHWCF
jgi:hypothetical protein